MVRISRSRRNRYAKTLSLPLFKRVLSAGAGSLDQMYLISNLIIRTNNSPILIAVSLVRLFSCVLKNSDRISKWNSVKATVWLDRKLSEIILSLSHRCTKCMPFTKKSYKGSYSTSWKHGSQPNSAHLRSNEYKTSIIITLHLTLIKASQFKVISLPTAWVKHFYAGDWGQIHILQTNLEE